MSHVDNSHTLDKNDLIAAATKLWGKPTKRGKVEWRFGSRGSKSIRLDKLVWRDHEADEDGGIVELCRRAGINGTYRKPDAEAKKIRDDWQPQTPPREAPINILTCDRLHTYRDANGSVLHYVKRFEGPPRKFLPLTWGVLNGAAPDWRLKAPQPPLPLYGLADLHELNPELVILVEGEKTADAANTKIAAEQLPWLAMSWYGGAGRAKDADVSPLKGRKVVIWPDADKAGLKARDALLELLEEAQTLNVEGLSEGFDAADLKTEEKIKNFVEARSKAPGEAKPAANADELRPGTDWPAGTITRDDFFAIMPQNVYVYIPTLEFWSATVIDKRIGRRTSTWICQNKPVEQITWAPGYPRIITDLVAAEGNFIPHKGNRIFNTYRPPLPNGGNPSQAQPWLNHIARVYPEDWQHIVLWLAHRVQHPEIKINHALVLGGAMGNGKDTLIEPVRRAVGYGNFRETYPQNMLRPFNSFVKAVILRINEARDLGEFDRFKFYDHIKTLLATPPFTTPCNEKHLKEYEVANVVSVIITTNHKADGIFLPPDDRRHYVAWTQLTQNDFTTEYWDEIWGWYDSGGYDHVGAYLRNVDLSSFNPKEKPAKTRAFWEITDASRAPEDSELADVIDLLDNPDALTLSDLREKAQGEFLEWIKDRKNRRAIPHRLERAGYVPVRNPDRPVDGQWLFETINSYGGKISERRTVYARTNLSIRDQITAARHHVTKNSI